MAIMEQQMQQMVAAMAAMQQQMAEQQQALTTAMGDAAAARQETAQLQNRLDASQHGIPAMVQSFTDAMEKVSKPERAQLMETKSFVKPQAFDEKEEHFPGWRRKFENFVIGCFGESFRQVLHWCTDQETEITDLEWEVEFGLTSTGPVSEIELKVNQMYTALVGLTEDDSNDLVIGVGSGNGLEAYRKLCRRWDPNLSARKSNLLKQIISPPKCKFDELSGALERWKEQIRRYERRRDDKGQQKSIDGDVKLSALEMLIPADLENHLTLNRYRLKSFDDALAEVVHIIEARTGARIKEPSIKHHNTGGGAQPMEVDALTKGGGPKGGGGKGGKGGKGNKGGGKGGGKPSTPKGNAPAQQPFDGYCNNCEQYGHKASQCWKPPKDAGKGGKGGRKGKKGGKGGGKKGKKGAGSLEEADWQTESWQPEQECGAIDMGSLDIVAEPSSRSAPLNCVVARGASSSEDPLNCVVTRGAPAPAALSCGALGDAQSSTPGQEEWLKMNLDSGCALTTFPKTFGVAGKGNGLIYKTASGELIPDEGALKLTASDEFGTARQLRGRVANVHKALVAQSQVARAGQRTYLDDQGGWMFGKDSSVGKRVAQMVAKEAQKPNHGMMPLYNENGVYNFYLKMGSGGSIAPLEDGQAKDTSSELAKAVVAADKDTQKKIAALIAGKSGNSRPPWV